MQLQLVVVETGQTWRRALLRMVWDPKNAIGHNDYGSFERQNSNSSTLEEDKQLRGSGALPLSPLHNQQASTSNMSDTDLIQRQPLLPLPAKNGTHITVEYEEDRDDLSDDDVRSGVKANGVVKINIPKTEREEQRYPKEKLKTLMAFFCFVFGFVMATASLSLVHERVPDRDTYGPLPDIFFDIFPEVPWALDVSEIIIMVSSNITFLVMLFHKHRFIVFRRLFLIMSLLYLMRSVTMYVTVLPMAVPSSSYYCSPKANQTSPWLLTSRMWQLMSGFGLSINGKQTYCGDFIYSGHTVVLTMCYLIITEYSPDSPKRVFQLLSWLSCIASSTAVFMVLLARGHYTIDIIIAYFVTTRTFWIYHTLANNVSLKKPGPHNFLARTWWFSIFKYFEGNVGIKVPRQHEWPLPWPRRFLHKPPNRNS